MVLWVKRYLLLTSGLARAPVCKSISEWSNKTENWFILLRAIPPWIKVGPVTAFVCLHPGVSRWHTTNYSIWNDALKDSVNPFPLTTHLQQMALQTIWILSINEDIANYEKFPLLPQWFQNTSASSVSGKGLKPMIFTFSLFQNEPINGKYAFPEKERFAHDKRIH